MRDALEAVIKNSRVGFAPVLEMAHLVRTKWISVQVINKYTKLGIHQLNGIFILASVFLLGCQGPFQVLPRFPAKDLKYPPPLISLHMGHVSPFCCFSSPPVSPQGPRE